MVAGHRMHYYVDGPIDGRVIVLVHGLGGRSEDWSSLEPYLEGEGFRVYMPDLPGYGNSEQPADFSYSVPDEAAAVVGFLDALGLKQVDLGGWSMGGWIAQLVALGHPERVGRLMLFDSAGLYEKPAWDTRLFTPQTPEELDQLDALLMPKPPKVPGFIAQDILRHSKQNAMGDSAGAGDDAYWQGCHRRPTAQAQNAGSDRLGRAGSNYPAKPGEKIEPAHSAVATGGVSQLRPPGSQSVRRRHRAGAD